MQMIRKLVHLHRTVFSETPGLCSKQELGLLMPYVDSEASNLGQQVSKRCFSRKAFHCMSPKGLWRIAVKGGDSGGQRGHLEAHCFSKPAACGHCSGLITVALVCSFISSLSRDTSKYTPRSMIHLALWGRSGEGREEPGRRCQGPTVTPLWSCHPGRDPSILRYQSRRGSRSTQLAPQSPAPQAIELAR